MHGKFLCAFYIPYASGIFNADYYIKQIIIMKTQFILALDLNQKIEVSYNIEKLLAFLSQKIHLEK